MQGVCPRPRPRSRLRAEARRVLPLVGLLCACGDLPPEERSWTAPALAGQWLSDCHGGALGPERGARFLRAFDLGTYLAEVRVYDSRWCDEGTELYTLSWSGTYQTAGRQIGNLDGAAQLDTRVDVLRVTPHTISEATNADGLVRPPTFPGVPPPPLPGVFVAGASTDLLSSLGTSCSSDADCPFAACDGDTCSPCAGPGCTDHWRQACARYGVPELARGDVLRDIVLVEGSDMYLGDPGGAWPRTELERPFDLTGRPLAHVPLPEGVRFPLPLHGTWELDEAAQTPVGFDPVEAYVFGFTGVELIGSDLFGTYVLAERRFSRDPDVFELRRLGGNLVFFLYLRLEDGQLWAKVGTSASTATEAPTGPYRRR